MGEFVINNLTKILAWLITIVLVYLNMRMVTEQAVGYFESGGTWYWKAIIILSGLIFAGLLVMTLFFPWLKRFRKDSSIEMHKAKGGLELTEAPAFNRIAIALDFSENDSKLLAFAIGQSNPSSKFILIHVVESVPAKFYEQESFDYETQKDKERLENYAEQLKQKGFEAAAQLGFNNRAKEIARLSKENNADMLVIGAHGHSGVKDWVYGETIDKVRHELKIPVLIVNL